jgi:hypothetical protein
MKPKTLATFASLFGLAAILVLLPSASGAVAQELAPAGETISYSGSLSNDAGQPVADGAYAFSFALYDAAQDGTLLWSEAQAGVAVKGGAFSVSLGSATPLPQQARVSIGWLEVGVRGPGETDFTALAPRQLLNAAALAAPSSPAAGAACPHDHFGEAWTGNSNGTTKNAGLYVEDTSTWGNGIWGKSPAYGVYGESPSGIAVAGVSPSGYGVFGSSQYGFAMYAGSDAKQVRASGGWIKAMAYVAGTTISRCYNSQAGSASAASTPPCGFTSSGAGNLWTVTFGFQVNDRFISVTPHWAGSTPPSVSVDSFPTANSVTVRMSANSAFFIIVY